LAIYRLTLLVPRQLPNSPTETVSPSSVHLRSMGDETEVRATAGDAVRCKWSMVEKGYMKDGFVCNFIPLRRPRRASPLINRGTYARTKVIEIVVKQFLTSTLQTKLPKQILSLGAGSDTLFWRLQESDLAPKGGFYEVDFAQTTRRKRRLILAAPALRLPAGLGDMTAMPPPLPRPSAPAKCDEAAGDTHGLSFIVSAAHCKRVDVVPSDFLLVRTTFKGVPSHSC